MKNFLIILMLSLSVIFTSCKKTDFADSYADPSKISTSTVEKQYAGFLSSNSSYVIPDYWNYFVVLRTSTNRYTQSAGYVGVDKQYVPGDAGISSNWDTYYSFLAQYRELQKVLAATSTADQTAKRIFMATATIYLYDFTQKMVDLHGDMPFSEAGKLSTYGGDYLKSLPKYDDAAVIYTKMLDDLKAIADELNTITVSSSIQTGFTNQDLINRGSIPKWKAYCNSLRLRMLTRVSGAATFSTRATAEITAILANPTNYPVVAANSSNIQMNVTNLSSNLNANGFQSGLEDWNGNIAGKKMIDHMNANSDPRIRILFEPGAKATANTYTGLDQMASRSVQDGLVNGGTIAIYNRSTLSRNKFFPGVLINASEVSFLAAEAYSKAGNTAAAKTAYENGIKQSIDFYWSVRSLSSDNTAGAAPVATSSEITTYLANPNISFDAATTADARLALIAAQKWLHFNVVQSLENWAETRRLKMLTLTFPNDPTTQTQPPVRWFYPSSEPVYNVANYSAVKAKDNLATKLFWDVK